MTKPVLDYQPPEHRSEKNVPRPILVGVVAGILMTVPTLIPAFALAATGHSAPAIVLYPYSRLITFVTYNRIPAASFIAAIIQLPLYGWALGYAVMNRRWRLVAALVIAHAIAAICCFIAILPSNLISVS